MHAIFHAGGAMCPSKQRVWVCRSCSDLRQVGFVHAIEQGGMWVVEAEVQERADTPPEQSLQGLVLMLHAANRPLEVNNILARL